MNTSDKIIDINKARHLAETKKRKKNPFDRAIFEEGEFVQIQPLRKVEEFLEDNSDASSDDNSDIS